MVLSRVIVARNYKEKNVFFDFLPIKRGFVCEYSCRNKCVIMVVQNMEKYEIASRNKPLRTLTDVYTTS